MKVSELFEEERSVLSVFGKQPKQFGAGRGHHSDYKINNSKLNSLQGSPEEILGDFDCNDNRLTSLEGAPSSIGGNFFCNYNDLTSLHNIHKQIKHIGGFANFEDNPIKSHILGLLLIGGLKRTKFSYPVPGNIELIINKHLRGDRDVFACQEELIENGLDEYAQL